MNFLLILLKESSSQIFELEFADGLRRRLNEADEMISAQEFCEELVLNEEKPWNVIGMIINLLTTVKFHSRDFPQMSTKFSQF